MRATEFFRRFESMTREERFEPIQYEAQPTSFFVIFQKLGEVRKQKKRLEEQEEHLLAQAEEALKN